MAMTHEELIQEINQLPPDKRRALAEAILQSVQEGRSGANLGEQEEATRDEKMAAFHFLRGMLKTDGPAPTDQELKEDYINYLAEKYS